MNNHRFDDLACAASARASLRTSRRQFLRIAGLGAATAIAAGSSQVIAQDDPATPTALPEEGTRLPGGKSFQDVAFDLNFDIDAIFRFVADEVRYEPYAGVLRGAKGTLWGLAGNSADKALLLAALLKEALVDVRFAVGQLDDDAAAKIVAATVIDAATAHAHTDKVMAMPSSDESVDTSNLTPEQARALEQLPQTREELLTIAEKRLAESVEMIGTALDDAGVTLPAQQTELPDLERSKHIWVQYASGSVWIDLDPSLPGANPGETLATASESIRELPAELFHTVDIRVVAETVAGGQLSRSDLVSHQSTSQDLVGVPVTVMFAPPQAFEGIGLAIQSVFTGAIQWLPYILVADSPQRGTPLAFRTKDSGGDLLEGSDDFLGGGSSSEGEALAAWLTVDVHTPDGQTHHTERTIFDRVDAADRAAGKIDVSVISPIELVNVPELGDVYLPMLSVTSIGVIGFQVPGAYFDQDFTISDFRADLANATHGYQYLRAGLEADQVSEIGYRFYPNAPNVTAVTLVPTQIDESTTSKVTTTIDMLHQSYGSLPLDGATAAAAHPAIVSGALGLLTERALFGEFVTVLQSPAGKAFVNVGRVFEEAKKAGIPLVTLQPGGAPTGVDVSPQAAKLIEDALAAGNIVIVPERGVPLEGAPRTGWWQVNPQTGETIDRMETGGSQDSTEYTILLGRILAGLHHLHSLSQCIIGMVAGVVGIIALIAGSESQGAKFVVALLPYSAASCLIAFAH